MTRLLTLALALTAASCTSNTKSFDAEAWREGDARERGRMVRSLLASEALEGLTTTELVRLLGPAGGVEDSMSSETREAFGPPSCCGPHAYYTVDEARTDPDGFPWMGTLFVVLDEAGQSVDSAYVLYPMWE